MSVQFDPRADRYFVCPQSGPSAMGYGNFTVPNCYGGDCATLDGSPSGPYYHCEVRERFRDFYANGVQGGTPACKNERTDRPDLQAPFSTYAVNYFGDLDPYRARPYGTGYANTAYDAFGHYVQTSCLTGSCAPPENILMIPPVPGQPNAKTLSSVAFPGTNNVCTKSL